MLYNLEFVQGLAVEAAGICVVLQDSLSVLLKILQPTGFRLHALLQLLQPHSQNGHLDIANHE